MRHFRRSSGDIFDRLANSPPCDFEGVPNAAEGAGAASGAALAALWRCAGLHKAGAAEAPFRGRLEVRLAELAVLASDPQDTRGDLKLDSEAVCESADSRGNRRLDSEKAAARRRPRWLIVGESALPTGVTMRRTPSRADVLCGERRPGDGLFRPIGLEESGASPLGVPAIGARQRWGWQADDGASFFSLLRN